MAGEIYHVPGPCLITWGGEEIGRTQDGCIIRPRTELIPITDDVHGRAPADYIFAGKSAVVECIGLDAASLKKSMPWMGWLLCGDPDVGDPGAVVGDLMRQDGSQELIITERVAVYQWKAKYACAIDPSELRLQSTAELRVPLTFLILLDDNMQLFQTVPSYLE